MLLLWYTPPQKGAVLAGQYAPLARLRRDLQIRDDEVTLLLLWWQLNEMQEYKELNNG